MSIKDLNQPWHMPTAYLKVVLKLAASENRPIDQLLTGTGLNMENIFENDVRVSFKQTRKALANALSTYGSDWHLSLAKTLTISSHGPLGFATVTAPDLETAVNVLLRFIGIRAPFAWLSGTIENNRFVIRLNEALEMGDERMALVEVVMLSIQDLIERPLGREIQGARVTFNNPAPGHREQLQASLHADVVFDANSHSLSFPVEWLKEPCVLFDEAMHRYLVTRCEDESRAAFGVLPVEVAVRQALLANTSKFPSLSQIAASQHISPRTLIRRLKNGNTSYHDICETVRKTLATDYLLYSDMNVADIAYSLGYQDPSNFGRAFRGWFAIAPGRYRSTARKD